MKFWLRPAPGVPLSGPYTAGQAASRMEAGAQAWPEQELWRGQPGRREIVGHELERDGMHIYVRNREDSAIRVCILHGLNYGLYGDEACSGRTAH